MKLRENSLRLKRRKCEFRMSRVKFLGFTVGKDGLSLNAEKDEAVLYFTRATTVKKVKVLVLPKLGAIE
jgi:hypothetical protein